MVYDDGMSITSKTDVTRRGALVTLGASAAIASTATLAADFSATQTFDAAPLAWPTYHHLASVDDAPATGERVVLKREPKEPYVRGAISAYSERGQRLGYIGADHAQSLAAAMDRGDSVVGRVAQVAQPMQRGWSVLSLDLSIEPAFA